MASDIGAIEEGERSSRGYLTVQARLIDLGAGYTTQRQEHGSIGVTLTLAKLMFDFLVGFWLSPAKVGQGEFSADVYLERHQAH